MQVELNETVAHDDVTCRTMSRKILRKINVSATRIEFTLAILMPQPCNFLRNLTIHFSHLCILGNIFAQGYDFGAMMAISYISSLLTN